MNSSNSKTFVRVYIYIYIYVALTESTVSEQNVFGRSFEVCVRIVYISFTCFSLFFRVHLIVSRVVDFCCCFFFFALAQISMCRCCCRSFRFRSDFTSVADSLVFRNERKNKKEHNVYWLFEFRDMFCRFRFVSFVCVSMRGM